MSKVEQFLAGALLLGGFLLFAPGVTTNARAATQENSCVHCHAALPGDSLIKVKSHSWKGSIHQRHGVTCDRCHGGNPLAADKAAAHVGVLGSNDPKSPVYFNNIPATCGKCDGAEFYKFRQSLHYQKLEATGEGPECVTCHGSMETKILAPNTLVAVCQRCHNDRLGIYPYVPQKAKAVLLLIRESNLLLEAQERLYHPARNSEVAQTLRTAGAILHATKLEWHQFDLDKITENMQDFFQTLEKLPQGQANGQGKK